MAHEHTSPVRCFVRRLSVATLVATASDEELIERFALRREEAAFAALVCRHGPLVLGVCRRVLLDRHAAEDSFQETFLVLARKAGTLQRTGALGAWLYGVATRTALKAKARTVRRHACERRAGMAEAVPSPDGLVWRDLRPKLDEAIAGLPLKYRTPFVLHHLEGFSVAEVARRLGCPPGTAATRLARARQQLRARLARHGLDASAGALMVASAVVPPGLAAVTVKAALLSTAGEAAGMLFAPVASLITGGLQAMCMSKGKVVLAFLLAVSALGVGFGVSKRTATSLETNLANEPHRTSAATFPPERFFAGGFHTLRGFEFRGVAQAVGGVESNCKDTAASGHGLRLSVPLLGPAPIALDFAFPVLKQPEAPEQVFCFWIGLFS